MARGRIGENDLPEPVRVRRETLAEGDRPLTDDLAWFDLL